MSKVEKLFKVPVGDWSNDGHKQCVDYYVKANYSVSEMIQAYKDTCKKIGLQMNHNTDYTGIESKSSWKNWRYLLTEYEQNSISEDAIEILQNHGFNFNKMEDIDLDSDGNVTSAFFNSEDVVKLFMWFISYSMPEDFYYKPFIIEAEPIVGYWNNELNHQIGYGVFW